MEVHGVQSMSNKRLLVVDDNKPFLEFVRKVAVDLGYDVELSSNGANFKKIYEEFHPHSVIVDLIMPDIDGMEIIQWLANQENSAQTVQVIVVTGYSPEYADLAKMLGEGKGLTAVKTLTKPIKANTLRDALSGEAQDMIKAK